MTPTEYLRLALDPVRLAVLGSAVRGPIDADVLADELSTSKREVLEAIARLGQAGLVATDGRLDVEALRRVGRQLPDLEPASDAVTDGPWTGEETDVLRRFFEGDRLKEIPAQRSKRLVILERLVQEFEPGVRYPERQVNFTLQMIHPDYAALRRYMVDEGLMTRADGVYWRTGGRYDVDSVASGE